jgi:hypothetical protein
MESDTEEVNLNQYPNWSNFMLNPTANHGDVVMVNNQCNRREMVGILTQDCIPVCQTLVRMNGGGMLDKITAKHNHIQGIRYKNVHW